MAGYRADLEAALERIRALERELAERDEVDRIALDAARARIRELERELAAAREPEGPVPSESPQIRAPNLRSSSRGGLLIALVVLGVGIPVAWALLSADDRPWEDRTVESVYAHSRGKRDGALGSPRILWRESDRWIMQVDEKQPDGSRRTLCVAFRAEPEASTVDHRPEFCVRECSHTTEALLEELRILNFGPLQAALGWRVLGKLRSLDGTTLRSATTLRADGRISLVRLEYSGSDGAVQTACVVFRYDEEAENLTWNDFDSLVDCASPADAMARAREHFAP